MYQFFTREDFPIQQFDYSDKTYKVGTGQGAILQANDDYQNVLTTGLLTCVAFALINPTEKSALLIHFFKQSQITSDLNKLVTSFIKNTENKSELICLIAGGRAFNDSSEAMCDLLINYAKDRLLKLTSQLKLEINAPIVANDNETLSLLINLETGQSTMSFSDEESDEVSELSLDKIDFIDLRDSELPILSRL
ncbi:Uncharacterised protein [Legionella donaldsonii]|uniref:Chemotaxis protein CheD n=1 Tax=Legionella donaldsonii TaxID=45060 RepID=A0A378J286_9GAMM|nr:hypothetical protein [Legionella donaldsonii]STX41027.1 Uncharacterised protein [Legionella donaldsonii]